MEEQNEINMRLVSQRHQARPIGAVDKRKWQQRGYTLTSLPNCPRNVGLAQFSRHGEWGA